MNLSEYFQSRSPDGLTKRELANAIGVHAVLISQWSNSVREVPAARCPSIERATGGAVRCEDLRPDIDWAVLRTPDEVA